MNILTQNNVGKLLLLFNEPLTGRGFSLIAFMRRVYINSSCTGWVNIFKWKFSYDPAEDYMNLEYKSIMKKPARIVKIWSFQGETKMPWFYMHFIASHVSIELKSCCIYMPCHIICKGIQFVLSYSIQKWNARSRG